MLCLYSATAFIANDAGHIRLSDTASEACVTLVLDDRWTLGDVKHRVFELLSGLDPIVASLGRASMRFHHTRTLGESGLHHIYSECGENVDNDVVLSMLRPILTHGSSLLVWNGSTINDIEVSTGI